MEFTVRFQTGHDNLRMFDNIQVPDGLTLLRIAEEESGLKLNPSLISKHCNLDMKRTEMKISVQGQYAKQILDHPIFKHHTNIDVIIPEGWFGQFIFDQVYVERCEYDDTNPFMWICEKIYDKVTRGKRPIKRVSVTSTYKFIDVLDAWFHAGMPQYWGTTEERHVEWKLRELACEEERQRRDNEYQREQRKREAEQAEKLRLENAEKKTVRLSMLSESLKLMAKEVEDLQKLYNSP